MFKGWKQPPKLFNGLIFVLLGVTIFFPDDPFTKQFQLYWIVAWLVVYAIGFIYWNMRI